MTKKKNEELQKLIGKLPENWEKMTLEEKIWQVNHKWNLLNTDDMHELKVSIYDTYNGKSVGVRFSIAINDYQLTEDGSCFGIPEPAEDGQVDESKIPEYLRPFLEECAYEDYDLGTDESKVYTCMLESTVTADTFEEAAEKMYFFLDLLTCGYEIAEIEWYLYNHPDLFPEYENDEDWEDDDIDDYLQSLREKIDNLLDEDEDEDWDEEEDDQ